MARFHRKDRFPRSEGGIPRLWLFTDERMGEDRLLLALKRLPPGSGIVFRHYGLPTGDREALFARVRALARRRRLILLVGGGGRLSGPLRADGIHRPGWQISGGRSVRRPSRTQWLSVAAHDRRDIVSAHRAGADLVFLSPVFATRSHPGARFLGPLGFGRVARSSGIPVIALGGMTEQRYQQMRALGAHGWAAIDALMKRTESVGKPFSSQRLAKGK